VTSVYRVLIADDEAPARARIRSLLAGLPRYSVTVESDSGPATLHALLVASVDIAFLDVQMPGLSGLEVLERLDVHQRPVIVFTTAYEQYALDAFEANAIDYLLKPYTDERFQETLSRVDQLLRGRQLHEWQGRLSRLLSGFEAAAEGQLGRPRVMKRFAARHRDRVSVVDVGEVDWIEASGDYVELHAGPARHLVRMTMQEVEERLEPEQFVRIHRSAIVQLARVAGLEPYSSGEDLVVLRDGTKLKVSRRYRHAVRERLGME
jgi:two-component system, LytTR family, response regulator